MFTSRLPSTRAAAVLLSVSIVWVFAACVVICGWERAAESGEPHLASTVGVDEPTDAPACEGCPDAAFLKATTGGRVTFTPESRAVSVLPDSLVSVTSSAAVVTFTPADGRHLLPAPPPGLLPTLRI